MSDTNDCPPYCFQGSTQFYDDIKTDEFTPSSDQIGLLEDHVGMPWEVDEEGVGTKFPPWIEDSKKSASEQYVEWFNGIWHTGDPSSWNEHVFTDDAVMMDPSGVSTGAKQAAASFLLLFKYFPGLRGLVVSWAANDREIIINWRFEILQKGDQAPFLVPVIDKFCFLQGRVSFRLANYDILTLLGYLSQTYGVDQLVDFLAANSKQAIRTGGIQRLTSIAGNLLRGLSYWPKPAPTGLSATGSNGVVTLKWTLSQNETATKNETPSKEKEEAKYRVFRSEDLDGDYEPLARTRDPTYEDSSLKKEMTYADPNAPKTIWQWIAQLHHWPSTTTYWYAVSPIVAPWKPTPVKKGEPLSLSSSRRKRLKDEGLHSRESQRESAL